MLNNIVDNIEEWENSNYLSIEVAQNIYNLYKKTLLFDYFLIALKVQGLPWKANMKGISMANNIVVQLHMTLEIDKVPVAY